MEIVFIKAIQKIVSRKLFPNGMSNFSKENNPKGFDGLEDFLEILSADSFEHFFEETDMEMSLLEDIATRLISNKDKLTFVIGPFITDISLNIEILNLAKILECGFLYASVPPNLQGAFDMVVSPRGKDHYEKNFEARNSDQVFESVLAGDISSLYLMNCDPISEHPNGKLVREAMESSCFVVVHATHMNATVPFADVVLPALTSYEESGSYTNIERRILMNKRAIKPSNSLSGKENWKVFTEIAKAMEIPMRSNSLALIKTEISEFFDDYKLALTSSNSNGVCLPQEKEGKFVVSKISTLEQEKKDSFKLILTPHLPLSGIYVSSAFHLWDMPDACIRMSGLDCDNFGILNGSEIEFKIEEKTLKLPVEIDDSIPVGLIFAPEGFLKIHNDSFLNMGEYFVLLEEKKENS